MLEQIIALARSLAPLVSPVEVTVEGIVAAIKAAKGAAAQSDDQADADLRALAIEALAAKAARDQAAAGGDPQ